MRYQRFPLPIVLLLLCAFVAPQGYAHAAARQSPAAQVVTTYQQALNASMTSGDVSAVVSLYRPDATVTFSSPDGVTKVFHGRVAIARFYGHLRQMVPGFHWEPNTMRTLSPTVVLSYERTVTPGGAVAGQCAHLFVTQGDRIASLDWVVYHA